MLTSAVMPVLARQKHLINKLEQRHLYLRWPLRNVANMP